MTPSPRADRAKPTEQQVAPGGELGRASLLVRKTSDGSVVKRIEGVQSFGLSATRLGYAQLSDSALYLGKPPLSRVFVSDPDGADPVMVALPDYEYFVWGWAGDRLVVVAGNEQSPVRTLLVEPDSRRVLALEKSAEPVAVSPDGRSLLVTEDSDGDHRLGVVDLGSGKLLSETAPSDLAASNGVVAQQGRWDDRGATLRADHGLIQVSFATDGPKLTPTAQAMPVMDLPEHALLVDSRITSDDITMIANQDERATQAPQYNVLRCKRDGTMCSSTALPKGVLQPNLVGQS